MKLKLANKQDINKVKMMYKEITNHMIKNNIFIWDEHYPYGVVENDINNKSLYILEKNNKIIAACVLANKSDGSKFIKWLNKSENVLYIERFAVNREYLNKNIGSIMLSEINGLAKNLKKDYLRLFVVDSNTNAIKFYLKNNFIKQEGMYSHKTYEKEINEYAYEREVL